MQNWGEEFNLTSERFITLNIPLLEIVVVGDENCGKTELIRRFWDQHESYRHVTGEGFEEYRLYLTHRNTDICIFEAKAVEYVKKTKFDNSVVFVLCYDVDNMRSFRNLEDVWLPAVRSRTDPHRLHFTVGIQRNPVVDLNSPAGIEREIDKETLRMTAQELLRRTRGGFAINCCFADIDSMATVFQIAFDAVFPPMAVDAVSPPIAVDAVSPPMAVDAVSPPFAVDAVSQQNQQW